MKKQSVLMNFKIVTFLLFCSLQCWSQFNSEAPWMNNLESSNAKTQPTLDEMVNAFNQYWLTHDKDKKGSGYKPFMRWENYWRNNEKPDGTLLTPTELWSAWKLKKNSKSISSNNSLFLKTSNWQAVGPFSHTINGSWSAGQGRVNVVYVDPTNSSVIYIGSPAGGIWKSTNAGTSWSPLSDELPQIGVSGIVTDPSNSNIIYIATGDKDAGDTYSIGVLKSTNGGLTWNTTGLSFTNTSTRAADIHIHPTNSNILWVATSVGLYKTTDAGTTWTKVINANIKDFKLKPGDPNTVYAVTTTSFYKSTDAGSTFSVITSGLPASSGRLAVDVTAANSSYVYVLSANTSNGFQGLYRSTDSGTNFTKTTSTTDIFESTQAWYDMALAVSPTNADVVFTGCLNIWKSTNGGTSFTKVNSWSQPTAAAYTHADIHFLRYYGSNLYCGSDGGIYVSSNDGTSFTSKTTGLQIGQFYKVAVSKQSANNMVGGLQDNGGYAYSSSSWKNYYGADGMDTAVDPNNSSKYYGFIQNGGTLYITTNGGTSLTSSVAGPASGNWVTPLVTNSLGEVFAGYTKVYRLNGNAWVAGTTTFASNIETLTVDPSNDNNMYASDGTTLYKSTDKGVNFTSVSTFPATIKDVKVHSTNSSIIYVVTQGTAGLVYQSTNGGTTFTSISSGLPSIGKNCIVHQANDPQNTLYVGTTLGVYHKEDSMANWLPFDTGLPNVSVTDLEINYIDNVIIAATYGRGIWKSAITTTTVVDTQAPTTPTNLAASGITSNSVTLSWTASTDNIGVTSYEIFNGSSLVTSTSGVSLNLTGLSPSTVYSFSIKAKDAAGNTSSSSNVVNVTTQAQTVTYCASQGNNTADERIGNVSIGSINNSSTGTAGYENFSNLSTNLVSGSSQTITITPFWTSTIYSEGYAVWIDYNNNGVFTDSGELVWSNTASTTTPVSGTLTIPTTAGLGAKRMRVSMKYNGVPTSCEAFTYGQVEDYNINIVASAVHAQAVSEIALSDKLEQTDLKLFPNPVGDILHLAVKEFKNARYKIYNTNGQILISSEKLKDEINVSKLSTGIYILEITNGEKTITKKFSKQ